jgi:hypothetical protein
MRRRSKTNATKTRYRKRVAIKRHRTPASRHHSGHRPGQPVDQLRRELDEAREQHAATMDVLRIVSASSGEVKPVFEAILNKAVRICEANFGILGFYEGDSVFRPVALHNLPAAYAQRVAERRDRSGYRPHPMGAVVIWPSTLKRFRPTSRQAFPSRSRTSWRFLKCQFSVKLSTRRSQSRAGRTSRAMSWLRNKTG